MNETGPPSPSAGEANLSSDAMVAHYRLQQRLGRGAMGVVYRAVDVRLERQVALKLIRDRGEAQPDLRIRFQREARAQQPESQTKPHTKPQTKAQALQARMEPHQQLHGSEMRRFPRSRETRTTSDCGHTRASSTPQSKRATTTTDRS